MNTSHKTFMAAGLFSLLLFSTALAQSSGILWKDGNVLTANQMQQLDNSKINVNRINTPNGVAGLDAGGNVTASIMSSTDWLGAWQSNSSNVDKFARGYEADILGGNVSLGDSVYMPRSLLIQSDPYGPYSAGCGIGNAMTGSTYNAQMPVSERDPSAGASSVVGVGQYDTVAHCELVSNMPARLVLRASGYTATSVQLAAPLTAAQAQQIHPNTYITTNSPDTSLTLTNTDGSLPERNLYAGFVSVAPAAGDTSISVYAWSVPGYGSSASGQIPQTTTLDTVWSKYTSPTVFLGGGAGASAFAENWFFNIDATNLTPSDTNKSLVHQLTPLEVDLNIGNGKAPDNSLLWQGISMNAGNQPAALTRDSHQLFLGGNINHHLIANGATGNWDIEADGFYVPVAHDGIGEVGVTGAVTSQLSAVWEQWIEGANRMQVRLYDTTSNTDADVGWKQAVVHLGPTVDGNPVQTGDMGGSPQGEIQWNEDGYYGGVSLCGYAANCGATILGNGHFLIRPGSDSTTQLIFNPPGNTGNPYLVASDAIHLSLKNSLGTGVVFSTYETDATNVRATTYIDLAAGASIIGRTSDNAVAGTLTPDTSGNWVFGTQVSGGANVSGINTLRANSAVANGYQLSAATYTPNTGTFSGQGGVELWNTLNPGSAYTEFVNVDPGTAGGFIFRDITTGGTAADSDRIALLNGSGILDYKDLYVDGNIRSGGGLFFNNTGHANAFYLTLSSDGKTLQAGTQVPGGANVSGINKLTVGNIVETTTYTLATLPTGTQDGEHVWCSDCTLNSVPGVEAYWHASAAKWTDSQNNNLTN